MALYPDRTQGRLGVAPSVGPQKCFWNEPLGALHPSPRPEPFFRLMVKNKERGQEGVSCLSKVYVTLPETTITLLKGRHTLVSPFSTQPCRAAGLGCGVVPPSSSGLPTLQSIPRGAEEVISVAVGMWESAGGPP